MKVFATVLNDGQVQMCEWTSQKAFMVNQSWIDPKFISVALTRDLDQYEFPYEKGFIVYTPEKIASHNLMHEKFKEINFQNYKKSA